ncbi:unnamed protein product [Symbiodinium sp. CCMP2592]|nr:unnamed protein product [Symbiodinium sp. CCMP2592]
MVHVGAARCAKRTSRLWSSLLVASVLAIYFGSGRLRAFVGGPNLSRVQRHARVSMPALASPEASAEASEFDRALLLELRALKELDPDAMSLRQRIMELRNEERQSKLAEDLLKKVRSEIEEMEVPILSPLRRESQAHGGDQDLTGAQLKRLAMQLYTKDAMPLVQEHVLGIIGPWDHLVRDYALQLSVFQVSQVYSMSAIFGYALRQAELRYGLEKATGDAKAATLSDYVSSLDSQEALLLSAGMSLEAQQAVKQQVTGLCGDSQEELWRGLIDAVGPALDSDEELGRLRQAIANGEVESVPISIALLRRIALEGVAFGFLLSRAEADSSQDLTFTKSETPRLLGAFKSTWGFLGRAGGKRFSDL